LRELSWSRLILDLVFLGIGALGLGAAIVGVWSVLQSSTDWNAWVKLLLGLPLGGCVGTYCVASVLADLIHVVVPSRLEGDPTQLQVRVWRTWTSVWQAFRRTELRVPRHQVKGVAFSTSQGWETQLFILHSSGLAFATGWCGSRAQAMVLKEALLRWIAPRP